MCVFFLNTYNSVVFGKHAAYQSGRRQPGPHADTHSAVHSGDGRSEDPILEGLLNRTSGDSATQHVKESNCGGRGAFRETHTGNLPFVTAPGHLPHSGRHPNPPQHSHTARQPQALSPARGGRVSTGQMSPTTRARAAASKRIVERSTKPWSCQENPPPPVGWGLFFGLFFFFSFYLFIYLFFFERVRGKKTNPQTLHIQRGKPCWPAQHFLTKAQPVLLTVLELCSNCFLVCLSSTINSFPHPPTETASKRGFQVDFEFWCYVKANCSCFLKLERYCGNPGKK